MKNLNGTIDKKKDIRKTMNASLDKDAPAIADIRRRFNGILRMCAEKNVNPMTLLLEVSMFRTSIEERELEKRLTFIEMTAGKLGPKEIALAHKELERCLKVVEEMLEKYRTGESKEEERKDTHETEGPEQRSNEEQLCLQLG